MKQSQFYYLLRRGLFSAGSAIIKNGLVMFNKFTTAGLSFPTTGSAEFNGTSDYIDLGTNLDESLNGDFTISAWVNSDVTSSQFILNSITTAGTKIAFGSTFSSPGFYIGIDNGSTYWAYNNQVLSANEWYHISATWDDSANAWKMYLDGSEKQALQTSNIAGFGSGSGYVVLGKRNGSNDQFFNGNLANVAIWNRALSSDEINSVMWKSYEGLEGAESNGLQAWYSLDDITSPAASLANMEQLATDKDATIENKAAITAAINALS